MKPVLVDSNVLLDIVTSDPSVAEMVVGGSRASRQRGNAGRQSAHLCGGLDRKRGGARRVPLPDFYIGAHAAVAGFRLLTRDDTRYRTYFPSVELISP